MDSLHDHVNIQRLAYNGGYIKSNVTWSYCTKPSAKDEFEEVIGHEILQAYYGTVISWQHHGTSYYLPQNKKPFKGKETVWEKIKHVDFMDSYGESYPTGSA